MRLILPFLLGLALPAFGQSPTYTVSGTVTDPAGEPLSRASVMVLLATDTTLVAFGMADDKGAFSIEKVPQGEHLLKVSYVGSLPALLVLRPEGKARVDLGTIVLEAIAKDLFEVVVREAKAPMSIRGDTIEYDARKFKVPPGSTVEDLLRRLPGMEVKRDGTLLSEGQEIRRVTVDGRRFFGDDPQTAIKNLPAEGISKVQVFSGDSEEKKLTGLSSTSPEKTLNLELEEDFKKGGFGKVVAGGGTQDRAELKGMYSRFSPTMQLSVIGMGNNTGRNGMDWDDYQDFRGSQTMSSASGGDFGFGGNEGMYFIFGGGGDDDIFQRGSFFGGGGSGIPRNGSGGVNFSRFNDKTEFHGVYFFNHNQNLAASAGTRQTFLPEGSFQNATTDRNDRTQNAHQLNLRLEHKIDSFQTLSAQVNSVAASRMTLQGNTSRLLRPDATLSTTSVQDFDQDQDDLGANGSLVYSRKYRNQARRSAWSASYGYDQAEQIGKQSSDNRFYDAQGLPDSLAAIRQNTDTRSTRELIKSSLMHVEPLGRNFFSQSFYNFSHRVNGSDRDVWDVENGSLTPNDLLTRYYTGTMQVHRLGTAIRYAHEGLNVTLGLAGQRYLLDGSLKAGPTAGIDTSISRRFDNLIPKFAISSSQKRNQYLSLDYSVNAREPSIRDLQPVVDNSNPLYIRVGNPDLIPQIDHRIGAYARTSNPLRFTTFYANASYSLTENQFVQDQTVDSLLVTTARTINYKGGRRFRVGTGYNFPIVKNRLTVDVDYDFTLSRQFALVNREENATRGIGHGGGIELQINPSEFLTASLSARIDWEDIAYSVQSSQNQQLLNQSYGLDLSARLFWSIYLHTNFSYERWRNDRFGVDRDLPLLHASLSRVLTPSARWEVRLSVYDVFDRNLGISQSASGNLVSESRTQILTRYTMLSLTYNLRGISTDLKGDGYF